MWKEESWLLPRRTWRGLTARLEVLLATRLRDYSKEYSEVFVEVLKLFLNIAVVLKGPVTRAQRRGAAVFGGWACGVLSLQGFLLTPLIHYHRVSMLMNSFRR